MPDYIISGSAVSTGSFGRVEIKDKLFIGEDPITPGATQKFSVSSKCVPVVILI